jgi:5-(carboxyamino)imidazole ribonucleotide synthase
LENHTLNQQHVGIIGGGQLALMLADAALRMGLKPMILVENSFSPAALAHRDIVCGASDDVAALDCFFSQASEVIFENEFVNCELLQKVGAKWGAQFLPRLEVISECQDKLNQKRLFQKLKLPSSEFIVLDDLQNPLSQLTEALNRWEWRGVLKWSRMGYDGKGVFLINNTNSKDRAETLKNAIQFCQEAKKKGSQVYLERFVPFKRELAMIGVQSTLGEFVAYPLVISEQENGICSRVYGPAVSLGVDPQNEVLAAQFAKRLAQSIGLVGSFGIELFELEDGSLLVNEIAPRVHNSGHYSQNACSTDQFENHWRAVLGMPLGITQCRPAFAMVNLLGPDIPTFTANQEHIPSPGPHSHVHWYGKREIRALRKLGHLNGTVTAVEKIPDLLQELEKSRAQWVSQLMGKLHAK